MNDFFNALFFSPMPFLRYAMLLGIAGSIAFGIVGTWVVTRRLSSLAGAISHSVLGGIGLAAYLRNACGINWITPILGAMAAAVISAAIIAAARKYSREREDAVINAVWAVGMAGGLLFLGITPGYVDLEGYLFGNILLVTGSDLITVLILDCAVIAAAMTFFHSIMLFSFDPEFAEMRGLKTNRIYFMMLLITALTIVIMVNLIGIILVIALLTLPAAAAGTIVRRWGTMMSAAAVLCMIFTGGGLAGSYLWNLPPGPVIVLFAALVYVAAVAGKRTVEKYLRKKQHRIE